MVGAQMNPFCFWQRAGFWEGEREMTYWCMPTELTLCFFFFFLSLFPFFFSYLSFLFFFLVFYFVIPLRWLLLWLLPSFFFPSLLHTTRASFYSSCRGWILLFYPLTIFVWFWCTCRPPLDHLFATPHHQTKMTILFVSLPWHPFLLRCGCLLSSYPL